MSQNSKIPVRDDGLQISQHRRFQEQFWVAERCGWVVFGLIVLVALLGLTGDGPIARAERQLAGTTVEYPRITRWESSDEFRVRFGPGGNEHRLTLTPSFLKAFQIEKMEPQPDRAVSTRHGTTYSFPSEPEAGTLIHLHLRPISPGHVSYDLLVDEVRSEASTMVLP